MLLFEIAIILIAAKIAGSLSVRLGQPAVLGKLIVGVIIGPSVLGLVNNSDILTEISEIGVIILMFIAGLETNMEEFKKSFKSSTAVGVLGIVVPLTAGYATGILAGMTTFEALFLGLLLSATSVSISVQALKEMNQLRTKEGATILGAAVIDDVLVIIALAFLMSFAGGDADLSSVILKKVAFFAIAILAAWKIVPWVMNFFAKLRVTETVLSAAFILCFLFSYFADLTGVAAIIGAYIAGIAIAQTPHKVTVFEKVETVGYSFFIPVFFAHIGITIQLTGIQDQLPFIILLSVIAILTKLVGGLIGAKMTGFNWNSSLGIGSAMISRGEVALIIATIGIQSQLLTQEMFAAVVVVVLVTTLVTPPLMKVFFHKKDSNIKVQNNV